MIKIGFLGIGSAGSNVTEIAELYGYRTAVCNTSPEDLDAIQLIKNKVLLGSNGGAGKDRRLAKSDAKQNYEKILNLIKEKFDGIDMIYFVFSTGGGTGSGMSPMMIDVVRQLIPDKKFGCIAILPALNESPVAQINTIECLKEIIRLEIPSFIADNEKMYRSGTIKNRKEVFDKMNNYIIDCFNLILNTKRVASKYGNLDQQDIIKLLSTPGATVITTSCIGDKERKEQGFSFGRKIMSSWDSSYFAPIEYDKNITRMGFIYELPIELTKLINYDDIEQEIGSPLEIFEGFYEPDESNIVVSILTGLTYPISRINEIKKLISSKKIVTEDKDYDSIFEDVDTSWFNEARNKKTLKTLQNDPDLYEEVEEEYDEFEEDDTASKKKKSSKKKTVKPKKEINIEDIFANYD